MFRVRLPGIENYFYITELVLNKSCSNFGHNRNSPGANPGVAESAPFCLRRVVWQGLAAYWICLQIPVISPPHGKPPAICDFELRFPSPKTFLRDSWWFGSCGSTSLVTAIVHGSGALSPCLAHETLKQLPILQALPYCKCLQVGMRRAQCKALVAVSDIFYFLPAWGWGKGRRSPRQVGAPLWWGRFLSKMGGGGFPRGGDGVGLVQGAQGVFSKKMPPKLQK